MILFPIIERELRVAARAKMTYRNRFLAALAVIGVSAWIFYERRLDQQAVIGNEMFEMVSLTALIVSLLAGIFHTADSISEERREGTLGLLYLTDLKSGHVVFGKLTANSIPSFFALATIVPILGIPFLLGGVSGAEMARTALALLNALWFSVTAGLFASTLAKDDRVTRLITFGIVMGAAAVLPVFFHVTQGSAFWTWDAARDTKYRTIAQDFWTAMAVQFALSCVWVSLAAWRARAVWQENPPTARRVALAEKWREWSTGSSEERREWRGHLLDRNPAVWLACRRRSRTALLWAILGIGVVALVWVWQSQARIDPVLAFLFSVTFHTIIKVTVAFAAGRGLAEEARTGALELLLTTDLSPGQLIRGQLEGIVRSFGFAALVVLALDATWVAEGRVDSFFSSDFRPFLWVRIFFLIFDAATIAIYALWLGFRTQRSGRAAVRAFLMITVAPDLLFFLPMFLRGSSYFPLYVIWGAINVFFVIWAAGHLRGLREKASGRFAPSSAPG